MRFEDFIAPLGASEFFADYWGRKPLLMRANDQMRRPRFGWDQFNALFHMRPHWTEQNIKLILNSQPVNPDFYMGEGERRLANVRQIENFTAMGASLVVDAVQQISPDIAVLTDMLADRFDALAGANFYASFQGVRAFDSHFDTHEVFALHCEGRKRWRIYENRAENPVETLTGAGAQQMIDAAKGAVMMDITLEPGDLLYIPRGFFHDAIAIDEASLHLTLGFTPTVGKVVLRLLEQMVVEDADFRAYLPSAADGDGQVLADRLAVLGDRLAAKMRTRRFHEMVAVEQRRQVRAPAEIALPHRPNLTFFARAQVRAELAMSDDGATLRLSGGTLPVGTLADVVGYILDRPAFSLEELKAKYPHHRAQDIDALATHLQRLGLIHPYQPGLE